MNAHPTRLELTALALGFFALTALFSVPARAQWRDNRWDTGVAGNTALQQAINLAGGGTYTVPPVSSAEIVDTYESSSDSSSSNDSSSSSSYDHSTYSAPGSGISLSDYFRNRSEVATVGQRIWGPTDDYNHEAFTEERFDAVHGLWYGIRGIGRGVWSAASWAGNSVASLFTSNNYRVDRGRAVMPDGSVYSVWRHKNLYGIREGHRWCVRPSYEQIDLVGQYGAVAKIKGYYGMINPADGSQVLDFDYDKYRGAFYPDDAINFVVAFGKTNWNGRENWILALPDGKGGYTRSAEEYSDARVLKDGANRYRVICKDHEGKVSLIGAYGQEILPPSFHSIEPNNMVVGDISEDAVAHYDVVTAEDNKRGVADSKGNFVVTPMYEEVTSWKQYGYLCRFDFGDWKGYNLIGIGGEEIVMGAAEIQYSSWYHGEGKIFLRVKDEDGNNYILNTRGEVLISDAPDGFDPDRDLSVDERDLFATYLEKYTIYQQASPLRYF